MAVEKFDGNAWDSIVKINGIEKANIVKLAGQEVPAGGATEWVVVGEVIPLTALCYPPSPPARICPTVARPGPPPARTPRDPGLLAAHFARCHAPCNHF